MVFVTSDPHGHRVELVAGLQKVGLLDHAETWTGGDQHLWVLGDLMDRGPDGIGVLDLVRRLQAEAASAGGHVGALLGNHEVLAAGMHRFGHAGTDVDADPRRMRLALTWERNGGKHSDQQGLTEERLGWLAGLPALHIEGEHLLMHSDTVEYLSYDASSADASRRVNAVNAAITAGAWTGDIDDWQLAWRRLTQRYEFLAADGAAAARRVTEAFGVRRLVHGHSILGDILSIPVDSVTKPLLYADRQVLAIDGGVYAGGPCLVADLDTWPDESA